MVHLRATQKVLRRLPPPGPESTASDTALGDWFANRLVVDRQPLLILVSGSSLFPILEPARDVRSLPERLPSIVKNRLERLGLPSEIISPEIESMGNVVVARTNNRSVVGTMIDFMKAVPYHLPEGGGWGTRELSEVEARLAVTPCRCSSRNTVFPDREVVKQLAARWAAHHVRVAEQPGKPH
jgi:hypothetical protein